MEGHETFMEFPEGFLPGQTFYLQGLRRSRDMESVAAKVVVRTEARRPGFHRRPLPRLPYQGAGTQNRGAARVFSFRNQTASLPLISRLT
jgi:hypothetical protein